MGFSGTELTSASWRRARRGGGTVRRLSALSWGETVPAGLGRWRGGRREKWSDSLCRLTFSRPREGCGLGRGNRDTDVSALRTSKMVAAVAKTRAPGRLKEEV